jgi:hypothetical protein
MQGFARVILDFLLDYVRLCEALLDGGQLSRIPLVLNRRRTVARSWRGDPEHPRHVVLEAQAAIPRDDAKGICQRSAIGRHVGSGLSFSTIIIG